MAPTLADFLTKGFLPKELPPLFTADSFGTHVVAKHPFTPRNPPGEKHFVTTSGIHNLARPSGLRRALHIPNPFGYYLLCQTIVERWDQITRHIAQSSLTVSDPIEDGTGQRAVRRRLDGGDLIEERARVRAGARVLLRTDIARFYSSVYTHSLPWALDTKMAAKLERRKGLGNALDRLTRNLQDGQTLGIPIGPDASDVLAEIVATAVDRRLQSFGYTGFRFVDDFEFGFGARSEAEEALARVEEELGQFELGINQLKTSIEDLPIELDRRWRLTIKAYHFRDDSEVKTDELVDYFDLLYRLKSEFRADPVLAYGIARLRSVIPDNWPLAQRLMFQCCLSEPGALEQVLTLLHMHQDRGFQDIEFDRLIVNMLDRHGPLGHGSEVVWALWSAFWMERHIPRRLAQALDGMPDSFVAILCFLSQGEGLIPKSTRFSQWKRLASEDSLFSRMWLLSYEGRHRGWISGGFSDVSADYGDMHEQDVSFLNWDIEGPTRVAIETPTDPDWEFDIY